MTDFLEQLKHMRPEEGNALRSAVLSDGLSIDLYPNSVTFNDNICFFIGCKGGKKCLFILGPNGEHPFGNFQGEFFPLPNSQKLQCSPLNHHNANLIREYFQYCRPGLIGLDNSFGFGDRLGIANPAHIRALRGCGIKPILAQQSIRELQRTHRSPDEVLDAATWAVFQEGYKDGFGADADHLKTTDDVDLMAKAGYTFFTIDPSEYVVNEADSLPIEDVESRLREFTWQLMSMQVEDFLAGYSGHKIVIDHDFSLQTEYEDVLRALLKYGGVIAHTVKMYRYLKDAYKDYPSEVEVSVDETESVTSPFEHYLVSNELRRHDVQLVSLAPRFVGDFEKGIDYKGDIEQFKMEYIKHLKIAEKIGPYKISFHSGSDKFSVYRAVGSLRQGHVHVKTAGTSYLEALKTVAMKNPGLFRKILEFSMQNYDVEKRTYHVSGDVSHVPDISNFSDLSLSDLFEDDNIRQILHVNFGKVLTVNKNEGYMFRDQILQCLEENEETHYQNLIKHFKRHLKPFCG